MQGEEQGGREDAGAPIHARSHRGLEHAPLAPTNHRSPAGPMKLLQDVQRFNRVCVSATRIVMSAHQVSLRLLPPACFLARSDMLTARMINVIIQEGNVVVVAESEETKEKKGNSGDTFDYDTTRKFNATLLLSWLPRSVEWYMNAVSSSDAAVRTRLSSLTSSSFLRFEVTLLRLAEEPGIGVVKQTACMLFGSPEDSNVTTAASVEQVRPDSGLRSFLRRL